MYLFIGKGGHFAQVTYSTKDQARVLSHKAHRVSCLALRKSVPQCENPTVMGKVARVGLTVLSAQALLTLLQHLWGEPGRDGGVFFLGEHFNTEPARSLAATLATDGASWGAR